jgi:hypothetical protein
MGCGSEENRFDRAKALELYTVGSSWFSTADCKKGLLTPGQLVDLAVLLADYFSIPEEEIKNLESVLTIVGGKIVYAAGDYSKMAPPALPVSPDWFPVTTTVGMRGTVNYRSPVPRARQFHRMMAGIPSARRTDQFWEN